MRRRTNSPQYIPNGHEDVACRITMVSVKWINWNALNKVVERDVAISDAVVRTKFKTVW